MHAMHALSQLSYGPRRRLPTSTSYSCPAISSSCARSRSPTAPPRVELQALHHLLQAETRQAQEPRGLGLVALGRREGRRDRIALQAVDARAEVKAGVPRCGGQRLRNLARELPHVDASVVFGENDGAPDF